MMHNDVEFWNFISAQIDVVKILIKLLVNVLCLQLFGTCRVMNVLSKFYCILFNNTWNIYIFYFVYLLTFVPNEYHYSFKYEVHCVCSSVITRGCWYWKWHMCLFVCLYVISGLWGNCKWVSSDEVKVKAECRPTYYNCAGNQHWQGNEWIMKPWLG